MNPVLPDVEIWEQCRPTFLLLEYQTLIITHFPIYTNYYTVSSNLQFNHSKERIYYGLGLFLLSNHYFLLLSQTIFIS
jgi:hypothetical protein